MKFLFVSLSGLIGDIAWQVLKEGHEVRYFIESPRERDIAQGFVPQTTDWLADVEWADVIVFDDTLGQGEKAAALRARGKRVIGGSAYTDRLEDDRSFGQEELRKAGVAIIPYKEFDSFDEAIAYVRATPDRYVIKPSGEAQNVKRRLFVGEEEDGEDVIRMLDAYKKAFAAEIRIFQLQKRVTGVEVAVGAFFNGREFISPINVNFEHKKLFPGNIGPPTGEMGCYDDETEVLTRGGWKFFPDLTYEDEIATLNPDGSVLEYHRPSAIVNYSHHRQMLRIQNRSTDLLVTLDHNMYGQEANAYRKKACWGFRKARDLPQQFVAPRSAQWIGSEQATFILPGVSRLHYEGRAVVEKETRPALIPMDDWMAFFGLWLAEGWTTESKNYEVGIAQVNPRKAAAIEPVLARLPFRFKRMSTGWKCYDKQLWSYLRPFGGALEKFVPLEIKNLSARQLGILFDYMCLGDGNRQRTGFRIYYTSSKRLADDVQEILLKLGRVGLLKRRTARAGKIGQRKFRTTNPAYEVIERIKKTVAWLDRRDTAIVAYTGQVHCVTIPYHTLYVRRNGKPVWCGNTSMFWSAPNRIFNQTLKKMEPRLAEEGYVGYIDLNCIVNGNGIYPLEFTSRFGYPTIMIQQEGMVTPIGQFFYDLTGGNGTKLKVKSGFQIGVRIVMPPFPFDDEATFDSFSRDAAILFKKPQLDGIHIEDVKQQDGQWMVAGSSGVILVVVGTGSTMRAAQAQAYSRIKNIMIPNMYYRTDIGDRWFEDHDRLHNWGYLRES